MFDDSIPKNNSNVEFKCGIDENENKERHL